MKILYVIMMSTSLAWAQPGGSPPTTTGSAPAAPPATAGSDASPAAVGRPGASAPSAAPPGPAPATSRQPIAEADAAFDAGRYRVAQADYARAVTARPDAPAVHYRLAVSAAAAGDAPTAEQAAATVVRLDPGNPDAIALAVSQRLAQRRTAAPTPTRVDVDRALADGRLRTAARLAAGALAADGLQAGDKAHLLAARGRALLAVGRPGAAAVALREAAGLGVDGPRVWLALAQAYAAEGRGDAALTCFEAAAAIAPADGPVAQAARAAVVSLRRGRGKGVR